MPDDVGQFRREFGTAGHWSRHQRQFQPAISVEPEKIMRFGYGTELIQGALAYALDATVDYALSPDGVRCRIEIPVS